MAYIRMAYIVMAYTVMALSLITRADTASIDRMPPSPTPPRHPSNLALLTAPRSPILQPSVPDFEARHATVGHNNMGHNYMGHNNMGHNYINHNYMGYNYMGHNYSWQV